MDDLGEGVEGVEQEVGVDLGRQGGEAALEGAALGLGTFEGIIKELGLDAERFNREFQTREVAELLAADVLLSRRMGIHGTPAFFVNGRYIDGVHSLQTYVDLIEEELTRARELEGDLEFLRRIAEPGQMEEADVARCAGLVHDVGKLILASRLPEYRDLLDMSMLDNRPLSVVERETLGSSHAEVGAYVLGLWGLPQCVVEAVALHHSPERILGRDLDAAGTVLIANALIDERAGGDGVDAEFAERKALVGCLESWRARLDEYTDG